MKKTILKNGVRVITVPQKNTKVATVLVLVKTGSKNEEKRVSGISHFLEHMLFKGTKKRKTPVKIAEELDKIGGIYNAFTGEDYTGYYAKVKSSFFPLAVDWVSDIYLNSTLPKAEVEKEKGVIKEEINMYYDNPMAYCQLLLQNLLYGDQPAGWDIAGTKESVSAITREDLISYRESQYTAKNTVVVVTGNVSKKDSEALVEKFFVGVKNKPVKEKQSVVERQDKPATRVFFKDTDQTHLCLAVRSFNFSHQHRYTQDVLASLLGGMMSSRLFIKIREEMGLAYYVRTAVDDNPDTGILVTQAGVDNKKAATVVRAVLDEYRKLKEVTVSAKELQKTKDHLKGKGAIYLESSDAVARLYGLTELLEERTANIDDLFAKIDAVTAKDIQEVARQIFTEDNLNLAVVGPFKDDSAFKKELRL